MKGFKSALFISFLGIIILAAGVGCESNKGTEKEKIQVNQKITVILDYVPNTNHTGIYAAKELGYYADEGLDVDIVEPVDGVTETLVATGKGQFGISFQENVTTALTSESPLPIKAIGTIIQHNTSGFGSVAKKNIKSVADFEGKTYAGWGSPIEEAIIKGLMESAGADYKKLKVITSDGVDYTLLDGKVDLIWMFEAWDKISAQRSGMKINYIPIRKLDKRLDFYTPVIIANNDTITNNPDTVRKFMAATSKGYGYAIENPVSAAKILYGVDNANDLQMLEESQKFLASKYSEGEAVWGTMKDEVWNDFTAYMLEKGLIKKSIPASDCYTNEFLPD